MFDNVLRVVFVVWMGLLRSLLTHNITEHVSVSLSSAYLSTWNASYILFWVHLAAAYPIFHNVVLRVLYIHRYIGYLECFIYSFRNELQ